ncbi:hypothetical protein BGP34_04045 [Bacillus mycoides]|nr:hypothetical protein BGP34_04045 [Bacillus mycoides]
MKPDRVYLVCESLKNLHWLFRKKKKSNVKLNLYKLSLMGMGLHPFNNLFASYELRNLIEVWGQAQKMYKNNN